MAALNRELRHNLHKASLLCLLAHGIRLSQQCDRPLPQATLLSLLPHDVMGNSSNPHTEETLRKMLRWFLARKDELCTALKCVSVEGDAEGAMEGSDLTSVQVLVALLRATGACARLALVLNPVPFKPTPKQQCWPSSKKGSPSSKKGSLSKTVAQSSVEYGSKTALELAEGCGATSSATFLRLMQECGRESQADSGTKMECEEGGSEGVVAGEDEEMSEGRVQEVASEGPGSSAQGEGRRGRKRRTSTTGQGGEKKMRVSGAISSGDGAISPSSAHRPSLRNASRLSGGRGKGKAVSPRKESTTMCVTSPYFGQAKEGRREGCSGNDSLSDDSDFVPVNKRSVQGGSGSSESEDDNIRRDEKRKKKGKRRVTQRVGRKGKGVGGKESTGRKGSKLAGEPAMESEEFQSEEHREKECEGKSLYGEETQLCY